MTTITAAEVRARLVLTRADLTKAEMDYAQTTGAVVVDAVVAEWVEVQQGDGVARIEGDAVRAWLEAARRE